MTTPSAAWVKFTTVESLASRWVTWAASCSAVCVPPKLDATTPQPGFLAGGQQHADLSTGDDDGGDVAPFHHHAAVVLVDQLTLAADQFGPGTEGGGDGTDGRGDGRIPDRVRDVRAADRAHTLVAGWC